MIVHTPIAGALGTLIALATRTDTSASLTAIHVPTLVLVGEQDPITPPDAAEFLQSDMARSRLVRIPEAGHLSNMENPAVFNAALLDFLKSLKA